MISFGPACNIMTLGFSRTSYLMKLQLSSVVALLKEVTIILRENYDSFTCTVLLQQLLFGLLNKYRFFGKYFAKPPWWSFVLIKSYDNVTEIGFQHGHFPSLSIFSGHWLCRAHANILYLNAFLVFDKEALLCSLSEPSGNTCSKQQLLWNSQKKNTQAQFRFGKAASCITQPVSLL